MKMNAEVKEEWLTRLKSGDYAQGRCYLRTANDEYCCLGVLTEIFVERPDSGIVWTLDEHGYMYKIGPLIAYITNEVADAAQLSPEAGDKLVSMNDANPQYSFHEIADWIEENL